MIHDNLQFFNEKKCKYKECKECYYSLLAKNNFLKCSYIFFIKKIFKLSYIILIKLFCIFYKIWDDKVQIYIMIV